MPGNTILTGCHYRHLENNAIINTTPSQAHRATFPIKINMRIKTILCLDFSLPLQDYFHTIYLHFHKEFSKLENQKSGEKLVTVTLICYPIMWKVGGHRVQGHPWLYIQLRAKLGSMRPCHKQNKGHGSHGGSRGKPRSRQS